MRMELLFFDGCPGHEKAQRSLEDALAQEEDAWGGFELVAVNTNEDAQRLRFPGSPTIGRPSPHCPGRDEQSPGGST